MVEETTDTTSSQTHYVSGEKANELGRRAYSVRGDSADEIDPRKLVRDPTLSELRWYYRRTLGRILVNKPVQDAYKNGYELDGRDAAKSQERLDKVDWDYYHELGRIKARRDGMSVMFVGTKDSTPDVSYGLFNDDGRLKTNVIVDDITHLKVFTIDDFAKCGNVEIADDIKREFGLEHNEFDVRHTGIVVSKKVDDKDYRKPLGYVLRTGQSNYQFLHRDRCIHLVENHYVDGDYHPDNGRLGVNRWHDKRPLGEFEGDSVLVASYDLVKGLSKGNWSVMQALFRNASNIYAVHLPSDADEEERAAARSALRNINAKSDLIFPRGQHETESYEVQQFTSGDMVEPREYFDVIFEQICAVHEMTKSVLFGTQSGVVSGSETDIKNYFNQVERMRTGQFTDDMMQFLNMSKKLLDGRVSTAEVDVEVEWGPLFKISKQDQFSMFVNAANAMTIMINGYMLAPDEARSILSEHWSEWDLDLGALTEEQRDMLDRINLVQVGAYEGAERTEAEGGNFNRTAAQGTTQEQTPGSGMQPGQQTGELAGQGDANGDEVIDRIVDRVLERLDERLAGNGATTEGDE